MFVTDALNVVVAKTVVQHRGALKRLDAHDASAVFVFEIVTSTERAC